MVKTINQTADGAEVTIATENKEETISAQSVLVSIGFAPNCDNLDLEKPGGKRSQG